MEIVCSVIASAIEVDQDITLFEFGMGQPTSAITSDTITAWSAVRSKPA